MPIFSPSRLRQLDGQSQATAQQLVQLLNKQNQLLLERQNLAEEVDRLRTQVPHWLATVLGRRVAQYHDPLPLCTSSRQNFPLST